MSSPSSRVSLRATYPNWADWMTKPATETGITFCGAYSFSDGVHTESVVTGRSEATCAAWHHGVC